MCQQEIDAETLGTIVSSKYNHNKYKTTPVKIGNNWYSMKIPHKALQAIKYRMDEKTIKGEDQSWDTLVKPGPVEQNIAVDNGVIAIRKEAGQKYLGSTIEEHPGGDELLCRYVLKRDDQSILEGDQLVIITITSEAKADKK